MYKANTHWPVGHISYYTHQLSISTVGILWLMLFKMSNILFLQKWILQTNKNSVEFGVLPVCTLLTGNQLVGWLIWALRPFETVFQSISGRLPERGRKRRKRIDDSKNVQTTPTRTYYKRSRPLPYCNPNCRTPLH